MDNTITPLLCDPEIISIDIWNCIIDTTIRAITRPIEIKNMSLVNTYWRKKMLWFLEQNRVDPITFFTEIVINWGLAHWDLTINFLVHPPTDGGLSNTTQCSTTQSIGMNLDANDTEIVHFRGMTNLVCQEVVIGPSTSEFLFPGIDWTDNNGTYFQYDNTMQAADW